MNNTIIQNAQDDKATLALSPDEQADVLLTAYEEICKSYHAIDDFRTKLLGFLPIASIAGIFLLNTDALMSNQSSVSGELISFASVFAAAFTLALFLYEIRSIKRSDDLIQRGKDIEDKLGVKGQFYVCIYEHNNAKGSRNLNDWLFNLCNSKVAAILTYSIVFAAWFFIILRFGFGWTSFGCGISAFLTGLGLAVGAYVLVNQQIAA